MDRSGLSPFEAPGSGDRLAAARRRGGAVHGRLVAAMDGDAAPEPQLALAGCDASRGRPVRRQGPLAAGPGGEGTRRRGRALAARPHAESDEEIAARLTGCARSGRDPHTVRGIGRWSAETLLIFQLRRLDVWPLGDHGVRRATGWRGRCRHRPRARPPIGGQSRPVSEKPIVRNVESDASSSWILSCGPINRLPGDRWRHVAQTRECAKLYPVGALVHLAQPIGSGLAASRPWVLADDNAGARQRLDRLDQLVVVHPRRTAGHDGRTHPCQRRSNGAGAHERSRQSRRLDPAGRSYPKNARLQSSARSSTSKSRYRSFWSSSLATLRGVLAPDTDARARGRAPRR